MEQYLPWLGPIIGTVALMHTIHSSRSKAATEKVNKIETSIANTNDRIGRVEDRASRLEAEMRHLPDIGTTHRIELAMANMETELKVLGERIKPVAAVSERLQELMMTERVNAS